MSAFDEFISRIEQKQSRRRQINRDLRQGALSRSTDQSVYTRRCEEAAKLGDEIAQLVDACRTFGKPGDAKTASKKETLMKELDAALRTMMDLQAKLTPSFGPASNAHLNEILGTQIDECGQRMADLKVVISLI